MQKNSPRRPTDRPSAGALWDWRYSGNYAHRTWASLGKAVGCVPYHFTQLTVEGGGVPSRALALRIEAATGGKVSADDWERERKRKVEEVRLRRAAKFAAEDAAQCDEEDARRAR